MRRRRRGEGEWVFSSLSLDYGFGFVCFGRENEGFSWVRGYGADVFVGWVEV